MSATCTVSARISSTPFRPTTLSRASGVMALSMRVAGAGGMFLSLFVLVRTLGVAGYGDYALAITWLQVLTVVAKAGLDNTSLRYVSEYVTKHETAKLTGFTRDSMHASLLVSMVLMFGVIGIVCLCWNSVGSSLSSCLIIAALMIPLVSLRQIQEASLRGIGQLFESQIGTVVWPWTLCLLGGIVWCASASTVPAWVATTLHLISISVVSVLVYQFYMRSPLAKSNQLVDETPQRQWRSQRRQRRAYETQQAVRESYRQIWKQTATAFLIAEILIVLKSRACVALAGMLLDRESVGIYGAMEKFADVSVLASQSLGMVIAPQFASLNAAGHYPEMRRLMRQGQLIGLATTVPIALIMALFGDYVLLLLGPGYREGWTVLMTLLTATCIAAFSGPAAYVLQMTGHERTMLVITAASAATNILLSLILMPAFGLMGLGIAQIATSVVWMIGVRSSLVLHPAWQKEVSVSNLTQLQLGAEESR